MLRPGHVYGPAKCKYHFASGCQRGNISIHFLISWAFFGLMSGHMHKWLRKKQKGFNIISILDAEEATSLSAEHYLCWCQGTYTNDPGRSKSHWYRLSQPRHQFGLWLSKPVFAGNCHSEDSFPIQLQTFLAFPILGKFLLEKDLGFRSWKPHLFCSRWTLVSTCGRIWSWFRSFRSTCLVSHMQSGQFSPSISDQITNRIT